MMVLPALVEQALCAAVFLLSRATPVPTTSGRKDLFDSKFERFVPGSVSRLMRQSFMAAGVGGAGWGRW